MRNRQLLGVALCSVLAACVGAAPEPLEEEEIEEEEEEEEQEEEEQEPPQQLVVSGVVADYLLHSVGQPANPILSVATLETMGIAPAITSSTSAGVFELVDVPVTSRFQVLVRDLATFWPTYNAELLVEDLSLTDQALFAASDSYMVGSFSAIPEERVAGNGVLFADLKRNNGEPFVDLTLEQVSLVDPDAPGTPLIVATYFFGGGAYVDPAQLTSTIGAPGTARLGVFNVAPGSYELIISYQNGQGQLVEQATAITIYADTLTLASTGNTGGGGARQISANPGFIEDIWPILQATTADPAGDGCANCHATGGLATDVIHFDDPADVVHGSLTALGLINLADPPASPILRMPTIGTLEPHATKFWSSIPGDRFYSSYDAVLTWIEQGAPLSRPPAP